MLRRRRLHKITTWAICFLSVVAVLVTKVLYLRPFMSSQDILICLGCYWGLLWCSFILGDWLCDWLYLKYDERQQANYIASLAWVNLEEKRQKEAMKP